MKKKTASPKISLTVALATIAFAGGLTVWGSAPAIASSVKSSATMLKGDVSQADSATTTTTTTTVPSGPTSGGLITDGRSRSECVGPDVVGSGLSAVQSAVSSFEKVTSTSVSCISTYLNGAPTWTAWDHPWITDPTYGYSEWVAEAPQSHQLVLQVDLIPVDLKDVKNPLGWERSCAAGNFNSHATQLGVSLVAAGLQNSVIRLGAEMNGTWEADFIGRTPVEQQQWVKCFDNEVVGLRLAPGEHFLIDWNPNSCAYNLGFSRIYPGNAYVNIMGIDLYDASCNAPKTKYSFAKLASEPAGLSSFEAFAAAHKKPMSLPEWGLSTIPSGDDPLFIDGIGLAFDTRDFAFESYFDYSSKKITALPLGTRTPLSIVAFQKWFGTNAKS